MMKRLPATTLATARKYLLATLCGCLFSGAVLADSPLADLIQAGDSRGALALLNTGANVNTAQSDGTTPLHWAVYQVDENLVKELLRREADPDTQNAFGSSPLSEAARLANANLVEQLLKAGADPKIANADGQTPLMLAAWNGSIDIARALVAKGANVNDTEQWTGQTALMWAAARNHPEMAQFLIEKGAEVNARATHFDWSSQMTSEPRGQYRPAGGLTPLLFAARSGCLVCVQAMLKAGADPNLPSPEGVTPLLVAIENFEFAIANYLLDNGAHPDSFDWWGRTPLYMAIDVRSIEARGQQLDKARQDIALLLAKRLLEAGAYVDAQMNFHRPGAGGGNGRYSDELLTTGTTPLLRAAVGHDAEAAKLLLSYGASVDLPNIFGITPLIAVSGIATPRGMLSDGTVFTQSNIEDLALETLEVLVAAGADVNKVITDTTSYTAEWPRHASISNRQGQTAIFAPGKWGWMKVAKFLVEHGAKVDVKDFYGKTPMDSAMAKAGGEQEETYPELAAYLAGQQ
ncbi:MAG: ankyrin repeat domain-containing protein [Pseudomonadota bacterium]